MQEECVCVLLCRSLVPLLAWVVSFKSDVRDLVPLGMKLACCCEKKVMCDAPHLEERRWSTVFNCVSSSVKHNNGELCLLRHHRYSTRSR